MRDLPEPSQDLMSELARLAVRVGLNLQEGQDLVMTVPTAALPLARHVTAEAYRAGARLVTPIVSDAEITRARFEHGRDAAFDSAPEWLYDGMAQAFGNGAARLAIVGEDPFLLSDIDSTNVGRANRANAAAYRPALVPISEFRVNWSIIACPTPAWAARIFPDLPVERAMARLADSIARTGRLDHDDPVAAWAAHNAALARRCDMLNAARFDALHFRGDGTDLRVGLAEGHHWLGGASAARNGVTCNPNIPTEEVFTTPDATRVDGIVRATKPLSYNGTLIDGIEMRFEQGRAVAVSATCGEDVLKQMLATDDGAARLGEVALVPHGAPVSQCGHLFYNTLFDENAASHIAMGQCYASCLQGDDLGPDDIARRGGNSSLIHVDWMIGDERTDVDGLRDGHDPVPLMRRGAWVGD